MKEKRNVAAIIREKHELGGKGQGKKTDAVMIYRFIQEEATIFPIVLLLFETYFFLYFIAKGERKEVEHLVFFVPGIEDMSAGKHRSVESLGGYWPLAEINFWKVVYSSYSHNTTI